MTCGTILEKQLLAEEERITARFVSLEYRKEITSDRHLSYTYSRAMYKGGAYRCTFIISYFISFTLSLDSCSVGLTYGLEA